MYKIYKLSLSEPVDFAAAELKKYLGACFKGFLRMVTTIYG